MKVIDIGSLIDEYQENKTRENDIKKITGDLGAKIKSYLINNNKDTECSNNWVAKITKSKNEELDEEKAISILKKKLTKEQFNSVVKTKQYIDEDALEKLHYNGEFDVSELNNCKTYGNETVTLRISKKK